MNFSFFGASSFSQLDSLSTLQESDFMRGKDANLSDEIGTKLTVGVGVILNEG
jgi:hypothetical protein